MIKISFFDSNDEKYINHNNINTITVQDTHRLLIKMSNGEVYISNSDIDTFIKNIKEFEKEINN